MKCPRCRAELAEYMAACNISDTCNSFRCMYCGCILAFNRYEYYCMNKKMYDVHLEIKR